MADPRDEMAELELANVPRIRVTPDRPPLGTVLGQSGAVSGDAESQFQQGIRATPWFSEFKQKYGEEPNLNDPNYDYRKAWAAGARPDVRDPGDGLYHWPSQFKGENHPNRYVNGVDTITGQPANQYTTPKGMISELPAGTSYRYVDPEPSYPPMQGRAPLEPDQSPGPSVWQPPRTPMQDVRALGGLVRQGFNKFMAGPPQENRQRFEGPYTSPQTAVQGAGHVLGALVDPARQAVQSQQIRFDPSMDPLTQEQARQAGPGAAAETSLNLLGIGSMMPVQRNAAGMFVPVLNPAKAAKAEMLEKAGATPDQIWQKMQVFRGKDNVLREEISDLKARFTGADKESIARRIFERENPNLDWNGRGSAVENAKSNALYVAHAKLTNLPGHQLHLEDVLDHPELYNHPAIKQLIDKGVDIRKTPVYNDETMQARGQYYAQSQQWPRGRIDYRIQDEDLPQKKFGIFTNKGNLERGQTFRTMLHEGEHLLANIFGTAKGHSGNPDALQWSPVATQIYENQMKKMPTTLSEAGRKQYERQAREYAADEAYRISHGEGIARVIADQRPDLTPKQSAKISPMSQMYPRIEQHRVEFNDPWVFGFGSPSEIKAANAEAQAARDPTKKLPSRGASAGATAATMGSTVQPNRMDVY